MKKKGRVGRELAFVGKNLRDHQEGVRTKTKVKGKFREEKCFFQG